MRGKHNNSEFNSRVPQHLIDKGLYSENSVCCHIGPGHIKRKQELLALIGERESMRSAFARLTESGEIDKYRHLFPNTIYGSRNRRLLDDQPSFTVTSHCLDEILHPTMNRAITPREAARLQSFPDWYQFAGPNVQFHGAKEQDKYEQIGDAIPPLLAYAIARQFVACLSEL
jgi:DNA (cytosine-5)-methyltransferase 1